MVVKPNRVHKLFSRTAYCVKILHPDPCSDMAKLPKRGNGAEHFFSTRARSWGKLFRPNCRFAGHSTVPFFRKGANMTPRRARERTAWGAHVITYGLFFKSVFWVSCKSADQTKMLQNSCSIRDCTAKKTRSPPLRRTPTYEFPLTPQKQASYSSTTVLRF